MPDSIYLHIPFCRHRCAYCDFNTYAGLDRLMPAYVDALCHEMACFEGLRLPVHTVYFGGGTPSLLPILAFEKIFQVMGAAFDLQEAVEISLEANPGTLSLASLKGLRSLGFNRLSLGVQSAQVGELRLLERQHTFEEVVQAVSWARRAGFENLNLDLIFGIPGQSISAWEDTLTQVLALAPNHLSLYALTVEENTPFHHWVARGLVPHPDPDLAADMYELASEKLAKAGFTQYEISNWASGEIPSSGGITEPRFACRHNLQYWRNRPYLGFGAGAHGYFQNIRLANVLSPNEYIRRLEKPPVSSSLPRTPATAQVTEISRTDEIAETMMMGLRLTIEGVRRSAFRERFGEELQTHFGKQIEQLTALGLLEWAGEEDEILRLTRRGRLLGNRVFMEFI